MHIMVSNTFIRNIYIYIYIYIRVCRGIYMYICLEMASFECVIKRDNWLVHVTNLAAET